MRLWTPFPTVDDKTEHMDRATLQALLQAAADDAEPGAAVQHEPRRDKGGAGSPDFKVIRQGRIAGYVEVKAIDEPLSKVLKSDQIKKYRTLSDNIVLTDYLEFCWIKDDGEVVRQRLAHSEDLSARRFRLKPEAVEAVRLLLRGFFSAAPQRIGRSQDPRAGAGEPRRDAARLPRRRTHPPIEGPSRGPPACPLRRLPQAGLS